MAVTLVIRMAHVVFAARMLVGAILLFLGFNDLLGFVSPDFGRQGMKFLTAMQETGYLVQLEASVLLLSGLLLVTARWVPLGLLLSTPVLVNMLAFHAFLAPGKIALAAVLGVFQIFLAFCYWPYFRALFVMNAPSRYGTVLQGGPSPARRPSSSSPRPSAAPSRPATSPTPSPPAPRPSSGSSPVGVSQPGRRPTPPGAPPRTP